MARLTVFVVLASVCLSSGTAQKPQYANRRLSAATRSIPRPSVMPTLSDEQFQEMQSAMRDIKGNFTPAHIPHSGHKFNKDISRTAVVSEECRTATDETCPVCSSAKHGVLHSADQDDACAQECTAKLSTECRSCRHNLLQQCADCKLSNADALIAAGCTQVACQRTLQRTCPVCPVQHSAIKPDECRACKPGDATAACEKCRTNFQDMHDKARACRECTSKNVAALAGAGCPLFMCKQAVRETCPDCDRGMHEEECSQCPIGSDSELCRSCHSSRTACKECLKASYAKIPSQCKHLHKGKEMRRRKGKHGGERVAHSSEETEAVALVSTMIEGDPAPEWGQDEAVTDDQWESEFVGDTTGLSSDVDE